MPKCEKKFGVATPTKVLFSIFLKTIAKIARLLY
jgi:hypothetical protein